MTHTAKSSENPMKRCASPAATKRAPPGRMRGIMADAEGRFTGIEPGPGGGSGVVAPAPWVVRGEVAGVKAAAETGLAPAAPPRPRPQ